MEFLFGLHPVGERVVDGSGDDSGLEVAVTGAAGFSADAIDVFEQINGTLFAAAFGLVFLLLILIYRSPILLWIPLLAVAFAELASTMLWPRSRRSTIRSRASFIGSTSGMSDM